MEVSPDKRSVKYNGTWYHFGPLQADAVHVLLKNIGTPLHQDFIYQSIGSNSSSRSLAELFNGKKRTPHPAWATMIHRTKRATFVIPPEDPRLSIEKNHSPPIRPQRRVQKRGILLPEKVTRRNQK
jgi:hypothetical protein